MPKMTTLALAGLFFVAAQPAAATQYLVTAVGTLFQPPTNPPGTTRLALPELAGQGFFMQFLLDGTGPGTATNPPGGVGEARSYFSTLVAFELSTGLFAATPAAGGSSQLFVLNDVGGNPAMPASRTDQVTFNAGTTFRNGVAVRPFDVDPALGPDLYISSLTFGRALGGTATNLPGLIDSVAFPELDRLWNNAPVFFSLQIRQGIPTSPQQQAGLPVGFLSGSQMFVAVERVGAVVPEPGAWAMLIAGFGMVGTALRRRAVAA